MILCSKEKDTIAEVVRVRPEDQSCNGTYFRETLLNEPRSDCGVHEGHMLKVRFAEHEGERYLVAEPGSN